MPLFHLVVRISRLGDVFVLCDNRRPKSSLAKAVVPNKASDIAIVIIDRIMVLSLPKLVERAHHHIDVWMTWNSFQALERKSIRTRNGIYVRCSQNPGAAFHIPRRQECAVAAPDAGVLYRLSPIASSPASFGKNPIEFGPRWSAQLCLQFHQHLAGSVNRHVDRSRVHSNIRYQRYRGSQFGR